MQSMTCVVIEQAQIAQLSQFRAQQQGTNTWLIDLDTQQVPSGCCLRPGKERMPHAKADLYAERGLPGKFSRPIDHTSALAHQPLRPRVLERPALTFGQPSTVSEITRFVPPSLALAH